MEIRPVDPRSPTFVDLFAGCGGMSLGLEQAGYRPIYVNEINGDALATYLANRPEYPDLSRFQSRDISALTGPNATQVLGSLRHDLTSHFGIKDVDLLVGGPPCQGFSRLGIRRTFKVDRVDVPSNHLYREMAKVIAAVRPRAFVFENVRGLMSSRWTPNGHKGEIWEDVLQAFGQLDEYEFEPGVVEARAYGVPQHRPRVIVVGVRRDIRARDHLGGLAAGLLPPPQGQPPPDPVDFLGDLVDPGYRSKRATTEYPADVANDAQAEYRTGKDGRRVRGIGEPVSDQAYSQHSPRIVDKFEYMLSHGGAVRASDRTRKFHQQLLPEHWGDRGPTITATSMPDDYVHFSQPRTLTVREWARLQTFPDWYQFMGERTTGGRRRAGDPSTGNWERQVPKYTQIGNAVPVRLARAIGCHLRSITQ